MGKGQTGGRVGRSAASPTSYDSAISWWGSPTMLRMVPVDPPYRWFSKRNWLMAKGTAVVHEVTLITGDGVGPELAVPPGGASRRRA